MNNITLVAMVICGITIAMTIAIGIRMLMQPADDYKESNTNVRP